MASNAIAIGGNKPKPKAKATVPQSLPANFYRDYKPPATPKINPQPQPAAALPNFEALPKVSGKGVGIDLKQPHSMNKNKHPMSMPARSGGLMGPRGTPFSVSPAYGHTNSKASKEPQLSEHKEEQDDGNSLVERTQQLKIGSFTCLDMMSGGGAKGVQQLSEVRDNKDAASQASQTSQQTASTFASDGGNEVAPDPEDEDEEDGLFDME